jgi:TusA-related sulfurtransferase
MGRQTTLSLEHIPWPISVLKCNQQVDTLRPGDELIVTLTDPATVDNLVMLLGTMKEFDFSTCRLDRTFELRIRRHVQRP